jgi:uncharacterized phage protein (TIGR01671 family)
MSIIKFRAWDDSISTMRSWEELLSKNRDGQSYYGLISIFNGENHHYHLERFTELYDRDKVEIYENDIVGCNGHYEGDYFCSGYIGVVTMQDGEWIVIEQKDKDRKCNGLWDVVNVYNGRVVGDIHHNTHMEKKQ